MGTGVLAAHPAWRSHVVPSRHAARRARTPASRPRCIRWVELLRRAFATSRAAATRQRPVRDAHAPSEIWRMTAPIPPPQTAPLRAAPQTRPPPARAPPWPLGGKLPTAAGCIHCVARLRRESVDDVDTDRTSHGFGSRLPAGDTVGDRGELCAGRGRPVRNQGKSQGPLHRGAHP